MRLTKLILALALLAPCVAAYAQSMGPDTAYYVGREDQREIDMDRQADRQIQRMQRLEDERHGADVERFGREVGDSIREGQLRRMRNELTDMRTQQLLRWSADESR